ncbi:MAG TPA: thiamine pyrophosphate-dependent enzyme [bacterium]|nr:thiamine pyrophosphate-dependent enzyme [bacterium]
MIKQITELSEQEYLLCGTRACSGCGLAIAYRHALKALGKNTIIVIPACCATVLQGMYPVSSAQVTIVNTAFETTASAAAGIYAGLQATKNKHNFNVVGWAGDGGTVDIGLQALSAAAERNDNIIYVCYDNEAYMNTGTQRSGATPENALTTTTPLFGKQHKKKDIIKIMEAHNIPYIATCSPAYPVDLYNKFLKAKSIQGFKFIYIFIPCPPGWGFNPAQTIKIGKLAAECGIFELFEIINGEKIYNGITERIKNNKQPKKNPVEYYSLQMRFKNLSKNK